MTDSEHHRLGSFTERAQQALSNIGQDERVKQAAVTAREVAERAEGASKTVSRKVGQEDLYSALLAGLIGTDDLAPRRWPHELAESMRRMRLTRFAPRTRRGLDAQLTPAERARWRSPDRQEQFARLLVDLINNGVFGPLCGDADHVRRTHGPGLELELIKDGQVAGDCKVEDHWELVAQHLAGMPLGGSLAPPETASGSQRTAQVAHQLEETGISHAVSAAVTLAVSIHPLGAAAGLGTRLVRVRIQAGQNEDDAFRQLALGLRDLRAEADRELGDMVARGSK